MMDLIFQARARVHVLHFITSQKIGKVYLATAHALGRAEEEEQDTLGSKLCV